MKNWSISSLMLVLASGSLPSSASPQSSAPLDSNPSPSLDSYDHQYSPDRKLSRRRRFLFPANNGWTIAATFTLTIPLTSLDTSTSLGTLVISLPFTYTVDNGTISSGRKRREVGERTELNSNHIYSDQPFDNFVDVDTIMDKEMYRIKFITMLEEALTAGLGKNQSSPHSTVSGHTCTLKLLCQVARTPNSEGMIGELFHLLLMPESILQKLPDVYGNVDYLRAQVDGRLHHDCSAYERYCQWSMFEFPESWQTNFT